MRKRLQCFYILVLLVVMLFILLTSCNEDLMTHSADMALLELVLKDRERGSVEILSLDGYQHEGYVYYYIRYSDELKEWDSVYRYRYGNITHYYNLNWGSDNSVLVQKDTFYDAVEYGMHKSYSTEEIESLVSGYYKK